MSQTPAIPSRVDGLDLLLGGGFRPFARAGGGPSLNVLIRGPAGIGKTILAAALAVGAARAQGTHVAYACVELLPEELRSQLEGLGFGPRVHVPPLSSAPSGKPSLLAGIIDFDATEEGAAATFVPALDRFIDAVEAQVAKPRVLVIDSLSSGYGLVSRHHRELADTVCKMSAVRGLFTVIVEESEGEPGSPWPFTVDVVIELRRGPGTERQLWVSKNRTGPADGAWTRFRIDRERGAIVLPPARSWYALGDRHPRHQAVLQPSPRLEIGDAGNLLERGPAIVAVSADLRQQPSWIVDQLLGVFPGGTSTAEIVAGFGRPHEGGSLRYIDAATATCVEEIVTSLLTNALADPNVAPVVRIHDIHIGTFLFGSHLPRELLSLAEVLRRRGCQVLLGGWPHELRDAADVYIAPGPNGTIEARRRGQSVATVSLRA